MMKRLLLLIVVMSFVGVALPSKAIAGRDIVGRVTDVTATSLSVRTREIVTVTLDSRTQYTKWITQKPWQEDTWLDARSLKVGRLVAVYPRNDNGSVAGWVQIATDMR